MGRWEAIWLTARDASTRFFGEKGRDGIMERAGETVGTSIGKIVGNRSGIWSGKQRTVGASVRDMVGKAVGKNIVGKSVGEVAERRSPE